MIPLKKENRLSAVYSVLHFGHIACMCPENLYKTCWSSSQSRDQATVYRNLKRLIQEHHHYFHCRVCDHSFEIPGCGLRQKAMTPGGFIIENHEVFLFGVCRSCRC